jgi:predicted N-acetyltransferase YhbS
VLDAAQALGERYAIVLGDPAYYPRFGFTRASEYGITIPVEAPDEAVMALALNPDRYPLPPGPVRYAAPFGLPGD